MYNINLSLFKSRLEDIFVIHALPFYFSILLHIAGMHLQMRVSAKTSHWRHLESTQRIALRLYDRDVTQVRADPLILQS